MSALKSVFVTAGALAALSIGVFAVSSNQTTMGFTQAASSPKEFVYDETVHSQVEYGGKYTTIVSNVETGISTPIATKLYREAGEASERMHLDNAGCFLFAEYSNQRTFAFEAGLNNLVGFEIQFKYNYREERDSGLMDPLSYNLTLTFYHNGNVVDTANYSLDKTTRNTFYTHTWTKDIEFSEKIDYVKCSLNNGGGGNKDEWRPLTVNYYKVCWTCRKIKPHWFTES